VDLSGPVSLKIELKAPKSIKFYDLLEEYNTIKGAKNGKFSRKCAHRRILRPSQRAFFVRAALNNDVVFVLARPKNSNKISLLVPIIHEKHLWLQETCRSEHFPVVLAALFGENPAARLGPCG